MISGGKGGGDPTTMGRHKMPPWMQPDGGMQAGGGQQGQMPGTMGMPVNMAGGGQQGQLPAGLNPVLGAGGGQQGQMPGNIGMPGLLGGGGGGGQGGGGQGGGGSRGGFGQFNPAQQNFMGYLQSLFGGGWPRR